MKTLIILLIISGILFVYFVVNAEKTILVKGSEVMPIGIDVPKLILNKMKELAPISSVINAFQPKVTGIIQTGTEEFKNKAENLISDTASKITNLIKEPIKSKINEILCPVR